MKEHYRTLLFFVLLLVLSEIGHIWFEHGGNSVRKQQTSAPKQELSA